MDCGLGQGCGVPLKDQDSKGARWCRGVLRGQGTPRHAKQWEMRNSGLLEANPELPSFCFRDLSLQLLPCHFSVYSYPPLPLQLLHLSRRHRGNLGFSNTFQKGRKEGREKARESIWGAGHRQWLLLILLSPSQTRGIAWWELSPVPLFLCSAELLPPSSITSTGHSPTLLAAESGGAEPELTTTLETFHSLPSSHSCLRS